MDILVKCVWNKKKSFFFSNSAYFIELFLNIYNMTSLNKLNCVVQIANYSKKPIPENQFQVFCLSHTVKYRLNI